MLTKRDFNISYPPYSLMMIRARLDLLQKTSQVLETWEVCLFGFILKDQN